ncbi:ParA family protein [Azospirillum sp. TSO35-2]|uniref:ParA family protein n=1 Tax=Azospirillum sp. TSO35-2 TaxID=716796 RepID=UPI001304DCE4|nr:ParA family protein [Azospirillum sp. TSO35-2]
MTGHIIAIGNLKGGTGKSTLAVNLSCALATGAGGSAVLVDADSQGTAVTWAGRGRLPVEVIPMPFEPDDAGMPSIGPTDTRPTAFGAVGGAEEGRAGANERWLATLNALAKEHRFVVIDLPPNLGACIVMALVAADLLVVPVTPSGADLKATCKAIDLLRNARKVRSGGKPSCLLVPSKVDRRTAVGREIEAVLHDFGEPVAPAIGQRSAHIDAFTAGEWIGTYAPQTAAHHEIQALTAIIRRARP